MSAKDLAARLRAAREKAGFKSATDAARSIGVNVVTYTAHENGTREFDRRSAALYAGKYGVGVAWLLLGDQDPKSPSLDQQRIKEIEMVKRDGGDGEPRVLAEWSLPSPLVVDQMHLDPSHCCFSTVIGDTMYDPANPWAPGSIMPGDKVLIDCLDRVPVPPGVFAVDDGLGYSLRVVEFIAGSEPQSVRLSSRNPSYSTAVVAIDSVKIVGRVRGKFSIL